MKLRGPETGTNREASLSIYMRTVALAIHEAEGNIVVVHPVSFFFLFGRKQAVKVRDFDSLIRMFKSYRPSQNEVL